jgi:hypothetical protein
MDREQDSRSARATRPEPIGIRKGRLICSGLRPSGFFELALEGDVPTPTSSGSPAT